MDGHLEVCEPSDDDDDDIYGSIGIPSFCNVGKQKDETRGASVQRSENETEIYPQVKRRKLVKDEKEVSTLGTAKKTTPSIQYNRNSKEDRSKRIKEQQLEMIKIAEEARITSKSVKTKSGKRRVALKKLLKDNTDVDVETKKKTFGKVSVLDKMENCGTSNGPMKVIYDCMKYGIKAKVWIRRYKGLRGVITGYIVAFDMHMNLAMIDVNEIFTIETWMIGKPVHKLKTTKSRPGKEVIRLPTDKEKDNSMFKSTNVPLSNEMMKTSQSTDLKQRSGNVKNENKHLPSSELNNRNISIVKAKAEKSSQSTVEYLKQLTENIKKENKHVPVSGCENKDISVEKISSEKSSQNIVKQLTGNLSKESKSESSTSELVTTLSDNVSLNEEQNRNETINKKTSLISDDLWSVLCKIDLKNLEKKEDKSLVVTHAVPSVSVSIATLHAPPVSNPPSFVVNTMAAHFGNMSHQNVFVNSTYKDHGHVTSSTTILSASMVTTIYSAPIANCNVVDTMTAYFGKFHQKDYCNSTYKNNNIPSFATMLPASIVTATVSSDPIVKSPVVDKVTTYFGDMSHQKGYCNSAYGNVCAPTFPTIRPATMETTAISSAPIINSHSPVVDAIAPSFSNWPHQKSFNRVADIYHGNHSNDLKIFDTCGDISPTLDDNFTGKCKEYHGAGIFLNAHKSYNISDKADTVLHNEHSESLLPNRIKNCADITPAVIQPPSKGVSDPRLSRRRPSVIGKQQDVGKSIEKKVLLNDLELTPVEKSVIYNYGSCTPTHEYAAQIPDTLCPLNKTTSSDRQEKLKKSKRYKQKPIGNKIVIELADLKDIVMDSDAEENSVGLENAGRSHIILPDSTLVTTASGKPKGNALRRNPSLFVAYKLEERIKILMHRDKNRDKQVTHSEAIQTSLQNFASVPADKQNNEKLISPDNVIMPSTDKESNKRYISLDSLIIPSSKRENNQIDLSAESAVIPSSKKENDEKTVSLESITEKCDKEKSDIELSYNDKLHSTFSDKNSITKSIKKLKNLTQKDIQKILLSIHECEDQTCNEDGTSIDERENVETFLCADDGAKFRSEKRNATKDDVEIDSMLKLKETDLEVMKDVRERGDSVLGEEKIIVAVEKNSIEQSTALHVDIVRGDDKEIRQSVDDEMLDSSVGIASREKLVDRNISTCDPSVKLTMDTIKGNGKSGNISTCDPSVKLTMDTIKGNGKSGNISTCNPSVKLTMDTIKGNGKSGNISTCDPPVKLTMDTIKGNEKSENISTYDPSVKLAMDTKKGNEKSKNRECRQNENLSKSNNCSEIETEVFRDGRKNIEESKRFNDDTVVCDMKCNSNEARGIDSDITVACDINSKMMVCANKNDTACSQKSSKEFNVKNISCSSEISSSHTLPSIAEDIVLDIDQNNLNMCTFIYHSIAKRLKDIKCSRTIPRIEGKVLKSTITKISPLFETDGMKGELSDDEPNDSCENELDHSASSRLTREANIAQNDKTLDENEEPNEDNELEECDQLKKKKLEFDQNMRNEVNVVKDDSNDNCNEHVTSREQGMVEEKNVLSGPCSNDLLQRNEENTLYTFQNSLNRKEEDACNKINDFKTLYENNESKSDMEWKTSFSPQDIDELDIYNASLNSGRGFSIVKSQSDLSGCIDTSEIANVHSKGNDSESDGAIAVTESSTASKAFTDKDSVVLGLACQQSIPVSKKEGALKIPMDASSCIMNQTDSKTTHTKIDICGVESATISHTSAEKELSNPSQGQAMIKNSDNDGDLITKKCSIVKVKGTLEGSSILYTGDDACKDVLLEDCSRCKKGSSGKDSVENDGKQNEEKGGGQKSESQTIAESSIGMSNLTKAKENMDERYETNENPLNSDCEAIGSSRKVIASVENMEVDDSEMIPYKTNEDRVVEDMRKGSIEVKCRIAENTIEEDEKTVYASKEGEKVTTLGTNVTMEEELETFVCITNEDKNEIMSNETFVEHGNKGVKLIASRRSGDEYAEIKDNISRTTEMRNREIEKDTCSNSMKENKKVNNKTSLKSEVEIIEPVESNVYENKQIGKEKCNNDQSEGAETICSSGEDKEIKINTGSKDEEIEKINDTTRDNEDENKPCKSNNEGNKEIGIINEECTCSETCNDIDRQIGSRKYEGISEEMENMNTGMSDNGVKEKREENNFTACKDEYKDVGLEKGNNEIEELPCEIDVMKDIMKEKQDMCFTIKGAIVDDHTYRAVSEEFGRELVSEGEKINHGKYMCEQEIEILCFSGDEKYFIGDCTSVKEKVEREDSTCNEIGCTFSIQGIENKEILESDSKAISKCNPLIYEVSKEKCNTQENSIHEFRSTCGKSSHCERNSCVTKEGDFNGSIMRSETENIEKIGNSENCECNIVNKRSQDIENNKSFAIGGEVKETRLSESEEKVTLVKESNLDMSKEVQVSISKESNLDMSKEGRVSISKEGNLNVSKEGQVSISKESNSDMSKEGQVSISKENSDKCDKQEYVEGESNAICKTNKEEGESWEKEEGELSSTDDEEKCVKDMGLPSKVVDVNFHNTVKNVRSRDSSESSHDRHDKKGRSKYGGSRRNRVRAKEDNSEDKKLSVKSVVSHRKRDGSSRLKESSRRHERISIHQKQEKIHVKDVIVISEEERDSPSRKEKYCKRNSSRLSSDKSKELSEKYRDMRQKSRIELSSNDLRMKLKMKKERDDKEHSRNSLSQTSSRKSDESSSRVRRKEENDCHRSTRRASSKEDSEERERRSAKSKQSDCRERVSKENSEERERNSAKSKRSESRERVSSNVVIQWGKTKEKKVLKYKGVNDEVKKSKSDKSVKTDTRKNDVRKDKCKAISETSSDLKNVKKKISCEEVSTENDDVNTLNIFQCRRLTQAKLGQAKKCNEENEKTCAESTNIKRIETSADLKNVNKEIYREEVSTGNDDVTSLNIFQRRRLSHAKLGQTKRCSDGNEKTRVKSTNNKRKGTDKIDLLVEDEISNLVANEAEQLDGDEIENLVDEEIEQLVEDDVEKVVDVGKALQSDHKLNLKASEISESGFMARRLLHRQQKERERESRENERDRLFDEKLMKRIASVPFKPAKEVVGSIFKRRHVNQLFIRGDNVMMIAYERPEDIGKIKDLNKSAGIT